MNAAPPNQSQQSPIPLTRLFLKGWRDLARSRDAILHQHYVNASRSEGVSLDDSLTLDEARQRFLDIVQTKFDPSDFEIDSLESKIVLVSRISAAWLALWTSFLPLVATGWWSTSRILTIPHHNFAAMVHTFFASLVLFFVASFCGLLIQGIFVRPFLALMNWFGGVPSQRRRTDLDVLSADADVGSGSQHGCDPPLNPSRWQRRVVWYSAWFLWLPVVGYGISQGNRLLAFVIGLPLFLLSINFSMEKLVCPKCNHVVRTIGTKMTHCMKCGAEYKTAIPTSEGS